MNLKGISEIIEERYGIVIVLGQKFECPFCKKETLSIKADDSIGKCFHPDLGEEILPK